MKYLTLFLLLFFTACSTKDRTFDMEFNKITFINKTDMAIENVYVYSQDTNKKMSCSFIPKNGHCSYEFKSKIQNNNNIIIAWKYNGKEFKYKNILKDIDTNKAVVINIDILKDGTATMSKL